MTISPLKGLIPLIKALQSLNVQSADDHTNIRNVANILKQWLTKTDWLEEKHYHPDPQIGFSSWLIHEEKDHTLAINLVTWEPGREIIPHDHQTWGVVGSVNGTEKNYFWTRLDDGSKSGYADIRREKAAIIRQAGEVICFMPNDIHSVINESTDVAISLHVYGKNLNYTGRSQFDPIKKTVQSFIIDYS
ncbi:putative Cupin region protein [Legionella lansingensis]|uniref:Putative Cupin region protein n=1 Tax=Legionella lansingensis TaxID=45067 RepID=A0A0W0VKC5_9GAMM|nr:cupin [Legionella lansingensis]KTD20281.1 putative Cupin region protein [Legionella lansingensis]SNV50305.1 putative Cupin region protein [Legionella lansingensis]